jgi:calpain-7
VVLQDIRIYALEKAITSDETQRYEDAYNWYMEASQRSLQLLQCNNYTLTNHVDERDNKVFGKQAREAIERATQLKKHVQQKAPIAPTPPPSLTQREIAVLKSTSTINGKLYYPWDDSDGIITNTELYVDPKGMLELSQEQKNHFSCWKRPSEFVPQGTEPVMINIISAYSITQSVVTDCSFVASLSGMCFFNTNIVVAAAYERKHNKKLISHCVYPQDSDGKPIYNPNGKYAVKLHMNGVARVVVIDDYLPVSSDDRLLCSYSTNRSELWVSLVEKAYMKLNGGYNFPGSNSGIDMHALTGWIPEEIVLGKEDRNIWNRLVDGHEMGHCVMTISTTQLSTQMENSLGLHSSHAYAILDIRTLKDGTRLLQLKNPWTRRRWKGKFSPDDQTNWTQDRLKEVNYDLLGTLLKSLLKFP